MSFVINVKDGTNGGNRRIRELPEWECRCAVQAGATERRVQLGRTYSCADCGARRPPR